MRRLEIISEKSEYGENIEVIVTVDTVDIPNFKLIVSLLCLRAGVLALTVLDFGAEVVDY